MENLEIKVGIIGLQTQRGKWEDDARSRCPSREYTREIKAGFTTSKLNRREVRKTEDIRRQNRQIAGIEVFYWITNELYHKRVRIIWN